MSLSLLPTLWLEDLNQLEVGNKAQVILRNFAGPTDFTVTCLGEVRKNALSQIQDHPIKKISVKFLNKTTQITQSD